MAKENEKKFSGEMNEEELENVAGGWCGWVSTKKPKLQSNQTLEGDPDKGDGTYIIKTNYGNGVIGTAYYDKKGHFIGGGAATCTGGTTK